MTPSIILHRLNYIGSKYQLLNWLTETIQEKTGWSSFKDKVIADLFAGTGVVSYHFRCLEGTVITNDAEPYSSVISHAMTCSVYSETCQTIIAQIQTDLEAGRYRDTIGYITRHYTPYESNERQFFTVENGQRIDYVREQIEQLTLRVNEDERMFLLASLIVSADAISNVPAVYGCYLKNFKAKSLKAMRFLPIHSLSSQPVSSRSFNDDVLNKQFIDTLNTMNLDMVYLDPPYNERQYSKNYFPLNMIAKSPIQLQSEAPLKGKTGIPVDCFLSPFCKRGKPVEQAFETLFKELKAPWIFLSYNSESLISKEKMIKIMEVYGDVSVVERDYKRFKSFDYNKDKSIQEYLFCLRRRDIASL